MDRVSRPGSRLRLLALLGLAAWSVHQLRYALAYGGGAPDVLRSTGHEYLTVLCPLLGLLLLAAAAQLLAALAARRHLRVGRPPSLARSWGQLSATLLAVFSAQELLEGALSAGHAGGASALVAGGGWLAVPL
ncbi:MAG: hypothetical protein JWM31_869, partial [Solirubrobacterales bacterium]|nr:hypothetical protein [Solirubrobacterales bacterium]